MVEFVDIPNSFSDTGTLITPCDQRPIFLSVFKYITIVIVIFNQNIENFLVP